MTTPPTTTFNLSTTSKPGATREDLTRIEYAISLVHPVLENMISDYGLPADVELIVERKHTTP
ncbi:MAG: hypothetical protein R2733_11745 [Acidimicrobiales bacterium]